MSSVDVVVITVEDVVYLIFHAVEDHIKGPGLEALGGEVDGFHVIHLGPYRGVGRPSHPGYSRGYHHNMLKAVCYNMCKNI